MKWIDEMYDRVSTPEKMETLIAIMTNDIKKNVGAAIIGMSGGADSTLLSALCVRALGAENVYGIGMPYNQLDADTFNDRSHKIATKLGLNYQVSSIGAPVDAFMQGFGEMSTLNEGNLRSRMRMIHLYAHCCLIAETTGKAARVMGTGNLSEDFIGYDTKGGDALADIFPMGQLYKYEVYALLGHLVDTGELDSDMIDRTPSAGLWDGQTDEDELGMTYNEMAPAIKLLLDFYYQFEPITTREEFDYLIDNTNVINSSRQETQLDDIARDTLWFVWNRHVINKHKHTAPYVTSLN
jgi:NAD+ synthase